MLQGARLAVIGAAEGLDQFRRALHVRWKFVEIGAKGIETVGVAVVEDPKASLVSHFPSEPTGSPIHVAA